MTEKKNIPSISVNYVANGDSTKANPIDPREWFLVPLFVINEAIERIKDGSIIHFLYDAKAGKIEKRR